MILSGKRLTETSLGTFVDLALDNPTLPGPFSEFANSVFSLGVTGITINDTSGLATSGSVLTRYPVTSAKATMTENIIKAEREQF